MLKHRCNLGRHSVWNGKWLSAGSARKLRFVNVLHYIQDILRVGCLEGQDAGSDLLEPIDEILGVDNGQQLFCRFSLSEVAADHESIDAWVRNNFETLHGGREERRSLRRNPKEIHQQFSRLSRICMPKNIDAKIASVGIRLNARIEQRIEQVFKLAQCFCIVRGHGPLFVTGYDDDRCIVCFRFRTRSIYRLRPFRFLSRAGWLRGGFRGILKSNQTTSRSPWTSRMVGLRVLEITLGNLLGIDNLNRIRSNQRP